MFELLQQFWVFFLLCAARGAFYIIAEPNYHIKMNTESSYCSKLNHYKGRYLSVSYKNLSNLSFPSASSSSVMCVVFSYCDSCKISKVILTLKEAANEEKKKAVSLQSVFQCYELMHGPSPNLLSS